MFGPSTLLVGCPLWEGLRSRQLCMHVSIRVRSAARVA